MSHQRAGIGHHTFHHRLKLVKPLDAVVDNKSLPVARQLEIHRLFKDFICKGIDRGQYGVTVRGRGGNGRKVAGTHQRELKGARNRGSAHRHSVDIDL